MEEGVDEAEHAEGEEPEVGDVVGMVTVGDFIRGVGPGSGGHCTIVGPGAEGEGDEEHRPVEVVEGKEEAAEPWGLVVVEGKGPRCLVPLQEGQGIDDHDDEADECALQLALVPSRLGYVPPGIVRSVGSIGYLEEIGGPEGPHDAGSEDSHQDDVYYFLFIHFRFHNRYV